MTEFHEELAKLLGIYISKEDTQEDVESRIISSLTYILTEAESRRKIAEDTEGMSSKGLKGYYDSWNGGGF